MTEELLKNFYLEIATDKQLISKMFIKAFSILDAQDFASYYIETQCSDLAKEDLAGAKIYLFEDGINDVKITETEEKYTLFVKDEEIISVNKATARPYAVNLDEINGRGPGPSQELPQKNKEKLIDTKLPALNQWNLPKTRMLN